MINYFFLTLDLTSVIICQLVCKLSPDLGRNALL